MIEIKEEDFTRGAFSNGEFRYHIKKGFTKEEKQQILEDQTKARKWDSLQNDLEKLGMTKEMKLLIEKSFANEFNDHNQNQKLRELVEERIEGYKLVEEDLRKKYKDIPKTVENPVLIELQQLLEEIKK